eukprot:CAMPEP_0195307844 /NCGR_PEP_ID=MMETSP0707-20130614/37920_1 /TAXON_ID=33640 /ORGANISM="Asterionellopsis glacialis, Strain CCMP134" /LENGTH=789 /DNA_ID=CAMNT_0040372097 /DNA_START=216 /DNA_END=2582 /DNA_ORIENTATION=-
MSMSPPTSFEIEPMEDVEYATSSPAKSSSHPDLPPRTDSMRMEQSLPTVDEIRLSTDTSRSVRQNRQKKLLWIFGIVFAILVILTIGMGIGLASKHKSDNSERTSSTIVDDEQEPGGGDGGGNLGGTSGEDRRTGITNYIKMLMVPGQEQLLDYTPGYQYRALEWLLTEDELKLGIPSTKKEKIRLAQRFALACFYFGTGGNYETDGWYNPFNFINGMAHECDWHFDLLTLNGFIPFGASCADITVPGVQFGDDTDTVRVVTNLRLPSNTIKSTLPDELGILTHLTSLNLGGNKLFGTLPSTMAQLTDIQYISLTQNQLTGEPIQDWMESSWSNLYRLFLDFNNFEGTLSPAIGGMTDLRELRTTANSLLTGSIPTEILQCTNLQILHMEYCNFNGSLPVFEAPDFLQMEDLRLSNNLLTSSIPPEYGTLTNLRGLFLDDNLLTSGSHPGGLGATLNPLSEMELLYLEDNFLEYMISPGDDFLKDMIIGGRLRFLDMSDNLLYGVIPHYFFNGPNLKLLDLHGNKLGEQPSSGDNIVYVEGNSLPDSNVLVNNPSLMFVTLHDNALGGSIPTSFGNLQSLIHVDLSSNRLTGPLPTEMGELTNMEFLFLASNPNLQEGPIPEWIQNMTNMEELSLKATARTGLIPSWIGTSMSKLLLLDLDMNTLSGAIPPSLGELSKLRFLLLNRNMLEGDIPTGLANLANLQLLLLDDNNLEGDTEGIFCNGTEFSLDKLEEFYSDCGPGDSSSPSPQVNCPCCTLCCDEADTTCNDDELLANYEPMWERGFGRAEW